MAGREGRGPFPLSEDGIDLVIPFGEGGDGLRLRGEDLGVAGIVARREALLRQPLAGEAHSRGLVDGADDDGETALELVVALAVAFYGLDGDEGDGGGGGVSMFILLFFLDVDVAGCISEVGEVGGLLQAHTTTFLKYYKPLSAGGWLGFGPLQTYVFGPLAPWGLGPLGLGWLR